MRVRLTGTGLLLASLCTTIWAGGRPVPGFVVKDSVDVSVHDGVTLRDGYPDDLLSAGLNAAGLQSATPPAFTDPLAPTPSELRRLAIWNNFRAITDMTPAGGYGLFWGPALAPSFPGVEPGLVPGVEYKALMRVRAGSPNVDKVPVAVQIPDHFDPDEPCVLLAPPSGSRGYYGGVAIGEWGLFEGCAVVLPGKGTGTGFHLLGPDEVYDRDGVLVPAEEAGRTAQFAVRDTPRLRRFLDEHPSRVATKHAHSRINPERLWGELALQGVEFGLWALNHRHERAERRARPGHGRRGGPKRFTPESTLVIASGTSNAAGTSLRAVEDDRRGLIDALVVIEPNVNPDSAGRFVIRYRGRDFAGHGTSLYDNHTLMGIYAPCAALSPSLAGTPFNLDPIGAPAGARANRCAALAAAGLLASTTLTAQAEESLGVLRERGYYEEQDTLLASHEWLNLWRSLNPTYAAAHGRFAVWENVCDLSFAATDPATGAPAPLAEESAQALFALSGGIPPTAGVNPVDDSALNAPVLENLSVSADSGLADLNLDGARCFRYLATGDPELLGREPSAAERVERLRVRRGVRETLTDGDLRGTPSIILTGRSDALVFPNYHSRPYYGLNQVVEGERSRLSYVEVANAQHFEAFISTLWADPVTGVRFVPLHYYLFEALDWMKDYLEGERPTLPPSQVLRPEPRGLSAYEASDAGGPLLPDIAADPPAADRIVFSEGVLSIPE